jgi:hypothetical protein
VWRRGGGNAHVKEVYTRTKYTVMDSGKDVGIAVIV